MYFSVNSSICSGFSGCYCDSVNSHQKTQEYIKGMSPLFFL